MEGGRSLLQRASTATNLPPQAGLEPAMHPIHPAAPSALALSLGALALALLAGCDRYDRLDRPLPKFTATTLDGRTIDSDSLAGKPWIINLWVPG